MKQFIFIAGADFRRRAFKIKGGFSQPKMLKMRITFPSGMKWITQSDSNGQKTNYANINNLPRWEEGISLLPKNPVKIKIHIFTASYIILQLLTLFELI
jgi:hypothetical protein